MAMFFIWVDLLPAVAVVSQFTPAACRKQAGQVKLGGVARAKGIGSSEEDRDILDILHISISMSLASL